MPKPVAIDADFLMHLLETKEDNNTLCKLIVDFFKELDYEPYMHPLVFEHEVKDSLKPPGQRLFDEGHIKISSMAQVLSAEQGGQQYYEVLVKQIYSNFSEEVYPCKSVTSNWASGKSLGEVHTAAMCAILSYDLILSDDVQVKRRLGKALKRLGARQIQVMNRQDCCGSLRSKTGRLINSKRLNKLEHSRC